jgi:hypothetical protein
MLRLVIRDVIVDSKRAHGQVWFQINWQTGAHEQFCYKRSVRSYEQSADVEAWDRRVRELNEASLMDAQVAEILNTEGYRTARLHRPFTGETVWLLREKWTIPTVKINNGKAHNPARWEDGTYSVEGAAARLGVFPGTIHKWLKGGKLTGYQLAKGMHRTGIFNRRRHNTASRMASTSKTIKERGIMTHSRTRWRQWLR